MVCLYGSDKVSQSCKLGHYKININKHSLSGGLGFDGMN